MKNKKTVIAIVSVIAVVLVLIGVTYAYWLVTKEQQGENVISSACLDISMTGTNDINLPSQYPMSDEDGMELVPFEFMVTNNCKANIDFQLNLETLGVEENTIIPSAIKVALNNDVSLLSEKGETSPTLEDAYTARKLLVGTLGYADESSPLPPSKVYYLRLWIDKDAPVSEQNKMFTSKITVTVGQNIFNPYKEGTLAYSILENYGGASAITELDATTNVFGNENVISETGLYKTYDDLGTTYYFRGVPTNNYVKFGVWQETKKVSDEILSCANENILSSCATSYIDMDSCMKAVDNDYPYCLEWNYGKEGNDMYWRIVRINGDGTIRLVYDGVEKIDNRVLHLPFIGKQKYNTTGDSKFVGYTYDVNGVETDSDVKKMLEEWYADNLEEEYGKYIVNSIFCNNRDISRTSGQEIYYAAYDRIDSSQNQPTLICANKFDRYTSNENLGNGLLTKPIGLITADEAVFIGSADSYLGSAQSIPSLFNVYYWTMTPSFYFPGAFDPTVFSEGYDESFTEGTNKYSLVNEELYIRPVINLKADVEFTYDNGIYTIVTE